MNLRDVFIKMGMISTGLIAEQKGPGEPEKEEREDMRGRGLPETGPGGWKGIPSKTPTRASLVVTG